MKSIILGIVIAALLIGAIAGAGALYEKLSEEYNKENNGGFGVMAPPNKPDGIESEPDDEGTMQTTQGSENAKTESAETSGVSEQTSDRLEETTEKIEETSEKVEETSEKIEETSEKAEVVFNGYDFTAIDWDGTEVKLSDFAGKPIVLNFWATWCIYCKEEMPEFDEAAKNLPDVQFIMLNASDDMTTAKNYITSQGYEFDVLFDTTGQAQHIYGVSAFPTTFFISADGSEIYYASGMLDYDTLLHGISLITD